MSEHERISDLLPLYVSGALKGEQHLAVVKHLAGCAECQADLALWKAVSGEIIAGDQAVSAPRGLAERALVGARMTRVGRSAPWIQRIQRMRRIFWVRRIWDLLRSQMPLVHREIWPASALVIALGFVAALISAQSAVIYALAPLVAAACVSMIYGPENDPAFELALSTPTSPRQILLARLALVFGYNLALVLVATLGLLPLLANQPAAAAQPHQELLGSLLLSWLAPMTFLSAAALALSQWIGAPNAISITYIAWLAQLIERALQSPQAGVKISAEIMNIMTAYVNFWQAPELLLILSALLFAAAVWLAGRGSQGRLNPA